MCGGLHACDHTNKFRYSIQVRQLARVSPGVSGLFRRNRLLQLVKTGVIEDLLVMKVQLTALFTAQLANCE